MGKITYLRRIKFAEEKQFFLKRRTCIKNGIHHVEENYN